MLAEGANVQRAGLSDYLSLVKFSHSIFALPFALIAAWVAAGGLPGWRVLGLVLLACVLARTAAMAFNRLVDRRLDALNPRTAGRELPAGKLKPGRVALLTTLSGAGFVATAFALNPTAGWMAFPVLAALLGYSYLKRVTPAVHLWLGLCLGLAPLGAWVAVQGGLAGDLRVPLLLGLAVTTWVAGFDLIYSCQDAEHDAAVGLRSVPASLGKRRALQLSRLLHVATVLALAVFGVLAGLGAVWHVGVVGAALLLAYEQSLVRADDLSRVDLAFFTLNGWMGVGLFIAAVLDLALGAGGA